jgi:monothiol glutaredoxin
MRDYFERIASEIKENKVVLYMKGSKQFPMCGFSAVVCQILAKLEVEFKDVNILEDEGLRSAIKEFSNWPTIPQLYINGEFIGGSDIAKQLYESGELKKILNNQ